MVTKDLHNYEKKLPADPRQRQPEVSAEKKKAPSDVISLQCMPDPRIAKHETLRCALQKVECDLDLQFTVPTDTHAQPTSDGGDIRHILNLVLTGADSYAKSNSTKGSDLGNWVPDTMPPDEDPALQGLGQIQTTLTSFGFHILESEESQTTSMGTPRTDRPVIKRPLPEETFVSNKKTKTFQEDVELATSLHEKWILYGHKTEEGCSHLRGEAKWDRCR